MLSIEQIKEGFKSTIGEARTRAKNHALQNDEAKMDIKEIAISILIVAFLIPMAFGVWYAVNTTGWDPQVVTIWGYIPLIVIIVIIIGFFTYIKSKN